MNAREIPSAIRNGETTAKEVLETHLKAIQNREEEIHAFNLVMEEEARKAKWIEDHTKRYPNGGIYFGDLGKNGTKSNPSQFKICYWKCIPLVCWGDGPFVGWRCGKSKYAPHARRTSNTQRVKRSSCIQQRSMPLPLYRIRRR